MTDEESPRATAGSVAEEMAALAEALRARTPRWESAPPAGEHAAPAHEHDARRLDACEICPVCRALSALHTISPATVTAMADLAQQAEGVLRALAVDLQRRQEPAEDVDVEEIAHVFGGGGHKPAASHPTTKKGMRRIPFFAWHCAATDAVNYCCGGT